MAHPGLRNAVPSFLGPILLAVLLVATGMIQPAAAGVQQWTAHGPEGAEVTRIVIDPTAPQVVYTLTNAFAGLFKSTDGGATWQRLRPPVRGVLNALVVDPQNPGTLYAATYSGEVVKSLDRGETWSFLGELEQLATLAIDPVTPSTLYAGTLLGGKILKSTDSGQTWQATAADFGQTAVETILFDPAAPSTLYVVALLRGVFKSTDGGQTWAALSNLPADTRLLVISPLAPSTLYASDLVSIFRSTDGGSTWRRSEGGPNGVYALAVNPQSPSTVYAGTPEGVFSSRDGGVNWVYIGLRHTAVYAVAVDPATPSTLYAGGYGTGVFKSTDEGGTWAAINQGLVGSVILGLAMDPTTPSTVYAITTSGLVFKTTDGGLTWSTVSTGRKGSEIYGLWVDPENPATLYANTSLGLFKTTAGGRRWRFIQDSVFALAIDPVHPSTLYASTVQGLLKSTNGGRTWSLSNAGLGDAVVTRLAIAPESPAILYASTSNNGVYKTTNAGQTWTPANQGLSDPPFFIAALAVDPTNSSTVYACDTGQGLVRTTDAGGHWAPVQVSGSHFGCSSVAIAATNPSTVYAGFMGDGVFRSTDGGETWSAFNDGLPNLLVGALAVDSAGTTVYAGTVGDGVFHYATVPPAPCVASDTNACLGGGRFGVRANFETAEGLTGVAHILPLTDDSAYFWFFNEDNVEAFLKVVPGCALNGRFWVFAAGLTDVRVELFVTDSATGIVRSYINPQGIPFQPFQDTSAFPCLGSVGESTWTPGPAAPASAGVGEATGSCTPTLTTLCLGGRFAVGSTFATAAGHRAAAVAVPLTSDTGYFWFFAAPNVEQVVKVLDACNPFGRFWFFAGGLTDVEVTTVVTDTVTGQSKTYVNPQGVPFQPIQDTDFLACGAP